MKLMEALEDEQINRIFNDIHNSVKNNDMALAYFIGLMSGKFKYGESVIQLKDFERFAQELKKRNIK